MRKTASGRVPLLSLLSRRASLLALGASFLLVLFTYGAALGYPFLFDSPMDLPRAGGFSYWEHLSGATDYSYYRPLAFVLWRALFSLLGRFDPFWFHLLPLLGHSLNGWLVYLVASRLMSRAAALAGGLLFLFYPFSYQVVPLADSVFHTLVALFALLCLLSYDRFRQDKSISWLAVSLGSAVLALFSHESGVVLAPLVLGWEFLQRRLGRYRNPTAVPAIHFALTAVFLLIWLAVPKGSSLALSGDSLAENGLLLLQGVAYPIVGFLGLLSQPWGVDAEMTLLLASLGTILGLALVYWLAHRLPLLLFSLFWFVVAVLPSWLVLPSDYLVDGPRLLYLASVGAALSWGGLVSLRWRRRGFDLGGRVASLALVALILGQSWAFLAFRQTMYAEASSIVSQLMVALQGSPTGNKLLVANLPSWLAPKQAEYPRWHLGVSVIPSYIGLERVAFVHGVAGVEVTSLTHPDLLYPRHPKFDFGPYATPAHAYEEIDAALRQADMVLMGDFDGEGWHLRRAGSMAKELESGAIPVGADFGGMFLLTRAVVDVGRGELALEWKSQQPDPSHDYLVSLILRDEGGQEVGREEGYPLRGLSPPRLWRKGEVITDYWSLPRPLGIEPGSYSLSVAIYEVGSDQRLPAYPPEADEGYRYPGDEAVIARIELPFDKPLRQAQGKLRTAP